MQITNTNTKNTFTGAFRFKPNEIKAQLEVPKLFTQGRQIFTNIREKGDQVIVVRDQYDKRIGKYIQENNILNVEYMPKINTKCGLDNERPQELQEILKSKTTKIITDYKEMFETISKQKKAPKPSVKEPYKPSQLNPEIELKRITNALRLNIQKPETTIKGQHIRIKDKERNRVLDVIAHSGTYYVYLRHNKLIGESIMCTINGKGEIIKKAETPEEIHQFMQSFKMLYNKNFKK